MKSITQKQQVIKQLQLTGKVGRNWALENYISRLGAIVCDLNKEGFNLVGEYEAYEYGKDFVYKKGEVNFTAKPIEPEVIKISIYDDIIQGSAEWYNIRRGKMTGSEAQAIANASKGLDTYISKIMKEMLIIPLSPAFENADMARGKYLEPAAVMEYEYKTKVTTKEVGFVRRDGIQEFWKYTGVSPDRLIGDDGGLEVKCLNYNSHAKALNKGISLVDSKHIWQVQMNLLITNRKWWDLALYNPNFPNSLVVFRIKPDFEAHIALIKGLVKGYNIMKQIRDNI